MSLIRIVGYIEIHAPKRSDRRSWLVIVKPIGVGKQLQQLRVAVVIDDKSNRISSVIRRSLPMIYVQRVVYAATLPFNFVVFRHELWKREVGCRSEVKTSYYELFDANFNCVKLNTLDVENCVGGVKSAVIEWQQTSHRLHSSPWQVCSTSSNWNLLVWACHRPELDIDNLTITSNNMFASCLSSSGVGKVYELQMHTRQITKNCFLFLSRYLSFSSFSFLSFSVGFCCGVKTNPWKVFKKM